MILAVAQTFAGIFGGSICQASMSAVFNCTRRRSHCCPAARVQSDIETPGLCSSASSARLLRHALLTCYLYTAVNAAVYYIT